MAVAGAGGGGAGAGAGGGGAGAGDEGGERRGGMGVMGLLLQAGLMWMVWNNFMGGGKGAGRPSTADGANATDDGALLQPPRPSPTATAAPNFLAAIPPNARITNAWEPSIPYSVAVFLATSPALLDDVSVLGRLAPLGANDGAAGSVGAPLTVGKLLSSDSNLYDLAAASPGVVYPNATFNGVVQCAGVGAHDSPAPTPAEGEFLGAPAARPTRCTSAPDATAPQPLFWVGGLTYVPPAGWGGSSDANYRLQHFNVTLPPSVLRNETGVWAHVYLLAGLEVDGDEVQAAFQASPVSRHRYIHRIVHPLTKVLASKPRRTAVNLLGGGDGDGAAHAGEGGSGDDAAKPREAAWGIGAATATPSPPPPAAGQDASTGQSAAVAGGGGRYWRPTLHIQTVFDYSVMAAKAIPPHLQALVWAVPSTPPHYHVPAHVNNFWQLQVSPRLPPAARPLAPTPSTPPPSPHGLGSTSWWR
jgi:hypothetical protein